MIQRQKKLKEWGRINEARKPAEKDNNLCTFYLCAVPTFFSESMLLKVLLENTRTILFLTRFCKNQRRFEIKNVELNSVLHYPHSTHSHHCLF